MSDVKLTLTHEGAQTLRDFATALPLATESIRQATDNLYSTYKSVEDLLGIHNQSFLDMLKCIKKMESYATEAIDALAPNMNKTADKIDAYVGYTPVSNIPSDSASSRGSLRENVIKPSVSQTARIGFNMYDTLKADEKGFKSVTGYRLGKAMHLGNSALSNIAHTPEGQKLVDESVVDDAAHAVDSLYAAYHPNEVINFKPCEVSEEEQASHTLLVEMPDYNYGEVEDSDYKARLAVTPINNGTWVDKNGNPGQRGESRWCPNDSAAKRVLNYFGVDGIEYKNAYPDFTTVSFFGCSLEKNEFLDSDRSQFDKCNFTLLGEIEDDPKFRKLYNFDDEQLNDLEDGKTPYGYTWHHDTSENGFMLLVPTVIHQACRHSGGRSSWGGGSENR